MRRAVICVSFMLAVVQLWPVIFGHWGSGEAVASPQLVPSARAAVQPAAITVPTHARTAATGLPTCYQRYERAYAACGTGNAACQLRTGDHWDVCEATGFWPE